MQILWVSPPAANITHKRGPVFQRTTLIVEGPLAMRTQRLQAARVNANGLEVLTLPQLAVRLAGGFIDLPGPEGIYPAVRNALAEGGFAELDPVRNFPGTPRAVTHALDLVWRADLDLATRAASSARLADLRLIEQRIEGRLPKGRLLPRRLRDLAIERVAVAERITGAVHIQGVMNFDPLWRPLINALAGTVAVTWSIPDVIARSWFSGTVIPPEPSSTEIRGADLCADPRAEVVEALRWVRAVLSRGDTPAANIAIAAPAPDTWDNHFLVLANDAGLPVHFSHGVPALSTPEGQACAALADILINGLNQPRLTRLIRRLPSSGFRATLPDDWASTLPPSAGLFTVDQWSRVLSPTTSTPVHVATRAALLPLVEVLARGADAANEAGELLFRGQARLFWAEALRIAPAEAISFSLGELRVPDHLDPGNSVVWCPSSHLAMSPRPNVRLLGMNSGAWPRTESEDPILPEHVIARRSLEEESLTDRDRRVFGIIKARATGGLWLSRARRNSTGSLQAPSSLWPARSERSLARTRVPEHAFSEADRLLSRPAEAGKTSLLISSRQCWKDWQQPELTPHDSPAGAQHPALKRALDRVQSVTSLRRLLRDPIGFVWQYALGWRAPEFEQQPLTLPPSQFGELVHELLRRTVQALEPAPGLARASATQIQVALDAAVAVVTDSWPLERAVPPPLLWQHTVQQAAAFALKGLTAQEEPGGAYQSWTEVTFGEPAASTGPWPWPTEQPIAIGQSGIRFGGRIDRIDLSADGQRARISDYKTGVPPKDAATLVFARGTELQRVLYALAAKRLLADDARLSSRLIYLRSQLPPAGLEGDTLVQAMADLERFIATGVTLILTGRAVPGPDAHERFHDMRLVLPADHAAYLRRKQAAFAKANAAIANLWGRQ